MTIPNFHILNNSLILSFTGKSPITLRSSDGRYSEILKAIKENRTQDIEKILGQSSDNKPSGLEFKSGGVYLDGSPLPESLAQRFMEYKEMNIPFDALILFWNKLKKNPNRNSVEMLYEFLQHNGHPITRGGNFIAYRKVRKKDGKYVDVHTGTMDNSPGSVPEMPRNQVDSDPNQTCSTGLHVAAWSYLSSFGGDVIMEVEVDPRDVVCVPIDYQGTKMRVSRFRVIEEINCAANDVVYVDREENIQVKKDKTVVEKVKNFFKKEENQIKDRFKVNSKNGVHVKQIEFWSSRELKGKGTLTVITKKGTYRYWEVSVITANKFLESKDQDKFYQEKIKTRFEGSKI